MGYCWPIAWKSSKSSHNPEEQMSTTTTTPNQQAENGQLEDHPIAGIFPLMGAKELDELTEAIKRSGQRETIVLHEGKILDGRNRYRACIAAGITKPRTRVWGAYEGDGDSPVRFVLDLNYERRHLTTGQKAAIATEALPFFEAEARARQEAAGKGEQGPGAPGEAVAAAAATMGVSARSVSRAKATKKSSKKAFDALKAGQVSLNAAEQEARTEAAEATLDEASQKLRDEHVDQVRKAVGDEFATAFQKGVVLKSADDLADFLTLDAKQWKTVVPLVTRGWTVKKTLKFLNKEVGRRETVADLILRTLSAGVRKLKWVVDGHEISLRMNVKDADASDATGSTE